MHDPVLLQESLDFLAVRSDGIYVDATTGLGGHTGEIARRLETGFVIANDRDGQSLAKAQENLSGLEPRIRFHHGRFSDLPRALEAAEVEKADGLLADLGVSRYQLTSADRGFSLNADGPLDMRMDEQDSPSAAEIVNHFSERDLADLIFRLGEERFSRRIARGIVRSRPIRTTGRLAEVVAAAVPRRGKIHPATLTFMALRRAVNREQE
jgi:16S rRNA (cytosine1402-N4)-methyltransferase